MAAWTLSQIPSQSGKLALVTGANSGIGWHTALELARAGAEVVLAVRSDAKGLDAVGRIRAEVPGAAVRHALLDLASLKSVREFAGRFGQEPKLDLLVNNAGVMAVPERRLTEDGFELQFGTNYLGVFALTLSLLPVLRRSPAPRVTTVASEAANLGLRRIRFEDIQWVKGYKPWNAYCQSKLADLLFAQELGRRAAGGPLAVLSTAAHPGYANTNIQTSGPGSSRNLFTFGSFLAQSAADGALPTLRAATETPPSSLYFGPDGWFGMKGKPAPYRIPGPARDLEAAQRLWELSEELTGVRWE